MIQRFSILSLAAAARIAATGNGPAVDISRYAGLAKFVMNSSATEAADNTSAVKLQHSTDGATNWTDVSGLAFAQVTNAAASLQEIHFNVDRLHKFVRVASTLAGTSPAVTRSVTLVGKLAY